MKTPIGRSMLVGTLFAVLVYAVLTFASDVRSLRLVLGDYAWWTFGVAIVLAFANYVLRFAKWEYYLRRLRIGARAHCDDGAPFERIPRGESFAIFLAGFSMSITPGKAGEVFRSALLASARGTPLARSAPIVIADRVTDLLALIALVAIGSAYFPGYRWIVGAALALVSIVFFFVFVPKAAHTVLAWVQRFGPTRRIAPKLVEAYDSLRAVMSPGAIVAMTALSIVAWGLECIALVVILRGLAQPSTMALSFFVYSTATVAGAIAMLPGGLGGTELTMRTMLSALGGLRAAPAAAATLLVRLATLWFAVILGFVALSVFRVKYDRHIMDG